MAEHTGEKSFLKRAAPALLAAFFFLYAFSLCLQPLADPDLWWHLKTGQWTLETRALPGQGGEDPFAYTSPKPLGKSEVNGMRSQWLGQVVFYLVFLAGGYPGLAAFRALLIVLPFIYIFVRLMRRGAGPLALAPLAFPPLFIAAQVFYTFERPQAFSFSLALLVYLLLLRLREGRGGGWLLPAAMALWANLHGGYVVGVAIIGAFAAGEAVGLIAKRAGGGVFVPGAAHPLRFFAVCLLGVAAAGLNPGGYQTMLSGLTGGLVRTAASAGPGGSFVLSEVLEYKPIWFFYEEFHFRWPIFLGLFFAVAPAALAIKYASRRRVDLGEALVCLSVALFGVYYAKGINFALFILTFMACAAGVGLSGIRRAVVPALSAAAVLFMLADTMATAPWKLRPQAPDYWVDASYPEGAAMFVEESELGGRMFNELRWGGYLTWRLYPAHKVFIDGRTVSSGVTGLYLAVIKGSPIAGSVLDTFDVNFIVVPIMSRENGVISPLVFVLTKEAPPRWKLVYIWDNAAVFVRDAARNAEVVACCSRPMSDVYREALAVSDFLLAMMPGHPEALLSKAIALFELGMHKEARQVILALPEKTEISEALLERLKDLD